MTDARQAMQLKEDDILSHYAAAYHSLTSLNHRPRFATPVSENPPSSTGGYTRRRFRSTIPGMSPVSQASHSASQASVVDTIAGITPDDPLPSEVQSHVIRVLRRGLAVANTLVDTFGNQTQLNALKRENTHGQLGNSQRLEFGELLSASGMIGLFTFASFVHYSLSDYLAEADSISLEISDPEEIVLENSGEALNGALWELDQLITRYADSDAALVRLLRDHTLRIVDALQIRRQGMPRLEAFLSATYQVEADAFTIDGFDVPRRSQAGKLSMSFKKPEEVIGNHIAKYQALKLAKMLMAYDFERQRNPFVELGGFIFTFMGDGKPGTGKTTLIQMLGGLLNDYCEVAGYALRYENLSTDNVDSFQGKSGQNAKQFIRNITDPHVIGFGTIDDIDQVAGKRGDRQSSAGQQEITAVLMESFAGANTVVRGNCTFGMFSNYPEQVDDALRQRAGARFLIDGPQSREDYIDILTLLLGKNHEVPLGDHDLYSNQAIQRAVQRSFEAHSKPKAPELIEVFDRVLPNSGQPITLTALGSYLKAIQEIDERFTGRAVKNITDAVKMRAMDFEIPDDWMEQPERFLHQGYDVKLAMLKELMTPITPEMVIQEINRYADSEFRYANASDEAAITDRMRQMEWQMEAERRLRQGS